MGFFKKMSAAFHDDWCKECQGEMEVLSKKLYMLPMTVGNYVSHTNPEYYKNNLVPVNRKADIPSGMYACGITTYWCSNCGRKVVKLSIFLPVRDIEKYEESFLFENGELDDFVK